MKPAFKITVLSNISKKLKYNERNDLVIANLIICNIKKVNLYLIICH